MANFWTLVASLGVSRLEFSESVGYSGLGKLNSRVDVSNWFAWWRVCHKKDAKSDSKSPVVTVLSLNCRRTCFFVLDKFIKVLWGSKRVKRSNKKNKKFALVIVFWRCEILLQFEIKAAMEVIKGSNGIDEVVLRNAHGSSVRVGTLSSLLL